MPIAIYPGSFDPPTLGHLDLIARGSKLFDRLIVGVLANAAKQPLFDVHERLEMLREQTAPYSNVQVESFDGLTAEYARQCGANVVLRGVRSVADYEYEVTMARMNRHLRPELDTAVLVANEAYSFLSSRLVKEVVALGGDVSALVPQTVEARLRQKFPFNKRK